MFGTQGVSNTRYQPGSVTGGYIDAKITNTTVHIR